MDDLTYLLRLPAELWAEIFSYFLQKTRPDNPDSPYPLAGTGRTREDLKTAKSLALTCRYFYDIAGPLLAKSVEIRSISKFRTPGTLNLANPSTPYLPSIALVDIRQRSSAVELYQPLHPSFKNVSSLLLCKPWWCGRTFPGFMTAVAESVGPQASNIYLVPSQNPWFVQDVVTVLDAMPQIRMLHIADVYYHDSDNSLDSDGASSVDEGTDQGGDEGTDEGTDDGTDEGTDSDKLMDIDDATDANNGIDL